ncbi:MAG: hypothetical protein WAV27_03995 [Xanthobacteraceae bacterium]
MAKSQHDERPERIKRKRRWVRYRDRFEKVQDDKEFEPPDERQFVGRSESGAALWLASKFASPDWSETAFTFLMDEEERSKFLEPFGYKAPEFVFEVLRQVAKVGKPGRIADQSLIEFYFAAIAGMKPRDPTETMLAAQMAALQPLILRACNQLSHLEDFTELESVGRNFNRLSRTFCNLIAAFDRHRMVGEHRVSVQQISVSVTRRPDQDNVEASTDLDALAPESTRQIPKLDSIPLQPLQEALSKNDDGILVEPARQKKKNGR